MEKGYDKGIYLYCRDITSHYHCKASPCSQILDHGNLQKFLLCVCHDKATPTVNPLAPCQNVPQENHAKIALNPHFILISYKPRNPTTYNKLK